MLFRCRSFTVITILLALALLIPGCGRKTALIAPQKMAPVAISDLRYFLGENGVRLEWTYPAKVENGDELSAIENFEVLRAEIPEKEYCEGCPVRFDKQALVEAGVLPAKGEERTATYKEVDLREGFRYLYKVRSRAAGLYPSSDSNVISFTWKSP
jgi:hypothetical protein